MSGTGLKWAVRQGHEHSCYESQRRFPLDVFGPVMQYRDTWQPGVCFICTGIVLPIGLFHGAGMLAGSRRVCSLLVVSFLLRDDLDLFCSAAFVTKHSWGHGEFQIFSSL